MTRLINKEASERTSLNHYYNGLRLVELRQIYRLKVNKDVNRAKLNRMDRKELANSIIKVIFGETN